MKMKKVMKRLMTRKRFRTLWMCIVVIAALLLPTAKVSALSTLITVSSDKTEADPGDVIDFSITIGPVSEMGTIQMVVDIPTGLTYVNGSGKLADGLKEKLGFDYLAFTDVSVMVNGGALIGDPDYSSDEDTLICTFQCTVDENFHGVAQVGLTELEFYSVNTLKNHTDEYSVKMAVITVSGGETESESTPEETTEAATQPDKTTEADTQPDSTTEAVIEPDKTTEAAEPDKTTEAATRPDRTTEAATQPDRTSEAASQTDETTREASPVKPSESTKDDETPVPQTPVHSTETEKASESTKPGSSDTVPAQSSEQGIRPSDPSKHYPAPSGTAGSDDPEPSKGGNEVAVSSEENSSAGSEDTATKANSADSKENTDKSGTKPVESDKNKSDDSSEKDSLQKGVWIWLAAAVMAVIAGIFIMIILSRKNRTASASERGRSRKRAK